MIEVHCVHWIVPMFNNIGLLFVQLTKKNPNNLELLDYGKTHNHDYFGQYCNHNYLTRL